MLGKLFDAPAPQTMQKTPSAENTVNKKIQSLLFFAGLILSSLKCDGLD